MIAQSGVYLVDLTLNDSEILYKEMIKIINTSPNVFQSINNKRNSVIRKRKSELLCLTISEISTTLILSIKDTITSNFDNPNELKDYMDISKELEQCYKLFLKNNNQPAFKDSLKKITTLDNSLLNELFDIYSNESSKIFNQRMNDYKNLELDELCRKVIKYTTDSNFDPTLMLIFKISIEANRKVYQELIKQMIFTCLKSK